MHCVSLAVWLAIATTVKVTVKGLSSTISCDDGWVTFQDKCYKFFNDDEETSSDALQQCHSFDAVLAYATNEDEMDFLANSVKGMDTYAWWTGLYRIVLPFGSTLLYFVDDTLGTFIRANDIPKPQLHKDPGANFNCIAYHPHYVPYYSYGYIAGMTTVDCHIKLPYVCSGGGDTVVSTKTSNYIQNGTQDLFYVSHPQDKLNYSAAQKTCGKKGMTLLSIRNKQILNFIDKTLGKRSMNKLEPWWTGLKVSYHPEMYNWTGNVPMNESVITWLPIPDRMINRRFLMLGSGNAMVVDYYSSTSPAPYICMKNSTALLRYNCNPGWIRGGGSCYKLVTTESFTWDKAVKYCSNTGSHLLTVNSKDEMSWLMVSVLIEQIYRYKGLWTSLNDRKQEDEFIWSDGSKLDEEIIIWWGAWTRRAMGHRDWVKPLEENSRGYANEGQCIEMYLGTFLQERCNEQGYYYGCQYKSSTGKCQDDEWAFFNGYCYLVKFSSISFRMRFNNAKAVCRILVDDRHVTPEVVKIESKEVYDFLALHYMYASVGIGLNSLIVPGTWTWADGTKADLSIFLSELHSLLDADVLLVKMCLSQPQSKLIQNFKHHDQDAVVVSLNVTIDIFPHMTEPNNGGGRGEEDCVAMTARGSLYDMPCNITKPFICEKEIQLTKTPTDGRIDNGGAALCKSSHTITLLAFIVLLLFSA